MKNISLSFLNNKMCALSINTIIAEHCMYYIQSINNNYRSIISIIGIIIDLRSYIYIAIL